MRNIPFSPPDITQEEIAAVTEVLKSGWITTGPKTKQLEREISEYCGTEKTICLNSATACMEMCLRLLGVGPGDEVITSAYTYTASASVIDHVGADIVLVDTKKDSFELSYEALAKAITPKTKVIIPVDIAGVMCDYDKIFDIVKSKQEMFQPTNELQEQFDRVIVLADAAHSFGAVRKGQKSGAVADFTSFSFHAVKNLTTAEGGALTWRSLGEATDEMIYSTVNRLSLHGQTKDALSKTKSGSWEYDIVSPAYKCNMTDVHAAIGLVQLKRYATLLEKRKQLVKRYEQQLADSNLDFITHYDEENQSSGHLFLVSLTGFSEADRNKVIQLLEEKGISTNVHYKPLPLLTAYKNLGFKIEAYPQAFAMYSNEITLPLNSLMELDDVDYVVENLLEVIKDIKK
ncbi:DegT/DnrJ/EryC1/StrS family aminotransferase [uncultured Enterococcus sp.]|uniref:DegT/DnrJ/EryC1/StrS family aminotransferase n=1 Tax=uncultured Enterococcus sp. TaxID=167972 RepID=UPI002AA78E1A|nr:DegT/DnrJ/EryC1/StrS family aminotransferase [uncultured Enterococcus sp.]